MLAALCPLTFASVCTRACVCKPLREEQGTTAYSVQCVVKGEFPKVDLSQTAFLSFCFSGEEKKKKKSFSPACFVVSLKGFAAVSIKRRRSKETPPTEIPTEEGEEEKEMEEEEGSGRLTDINIKDRR